MSLEQILKTGFFFLLSAFLPASVIAIPVTKTHASVIQTDPGVQIRSKSTEKKNYGNKKETSSSKFCVTKFAYGSVNWNTGKVSAIGKACPSGKKKIESSDYILKKAKFNASHHIMLILKKIAFTAIKNNSDDGIFHKNYYRGRITGKQTSHFVSLRDIIMAGIETIAADAKITEQHYTSDRAAEVTIETSIFGGFLQLVLPDSIREIPKIDYIGPFDKTTETKSMQTRTENRFTGLIIDVRGLNFHPAIYPVVISEKGEKIYSSIFISREYAVQKGVCGYSCTMDQALNSKRAGNNPIVIKGLRKGGKDNSTIIISSADAEKIEKAPEHYSFMKKCRVIIVLD